MNYKSSLVGSVIAIIAATSCCWLPMLIIAAGGSSTIAGLSSGLGKFSGLFLAVGILLLIFGIYQYRRRNIKKVKEPMILNSTITCPHCEYSKEEIMPVDACQYFYECHNCNKVLKPMEKDCCVFCSYGTVPCPPIQIDKDCCY